MLDLFVKVLNTSVCIYRRGYASRNLVVTIFFRVKLIEGGGALKLLNYLRNTSVIIFIVVKRKTNDTDITTEN